MNVLMVDFFSPTNAYTEELARGMKDTDITVLCRRNARDFGHGIKQIKKLYEGGNNKLVAIYKYLIGILVLKKELGKGYDIVHVQAFKNAKIEIELYRLYHRKNENSKLVHTVHNLLPHEAKKEDKDLYMHFYDICDALIVHNEESKRKLIQLFNISEEKISVVPHGAYRIDPPVMCDKNDGKVHYLMFGAIRHYKGLAILLKAISQIPFDVREKMEFVVAGKQYQNQDNTDYEKIINDLGISDCVRLINRRIEDNELPELFGWADACLFPYTEIYGSGALLMAYAYNLPVITSDVPVFLEETNNGRTGLIFESKNSSSLAKVLIAFSLMSNKDKLAMKDEIKCLVEGKYNWDLSAESTENVYKNIWVTSGKCKVWRK